MKILLSVLVILATYQTKLLAQDLDSNIEDENKSFLTLDAQPTEKGFNNLSLKGQIHKKMMSDTQDLIIFEVKNFDGDEMELNLLGSFTGDSSIADAVGVIESNENMTFIAPGMGTSNFEAQEDPIKMKGDLYVGSYKAKGDLGGRNFHYKGNLGVGTSFMLWANLMKKKNVSLDLQSNIRLRWKGYDKKPGFLQKPNENNLYGNNQQDVDYVKKYFAIDTATDAIYLINPEKGQRFSGEIGLRLTVKRVGISAGYEFVNNSQRYEIYKHEIHNYYKSDRWKDQNMETTKKTKSGMLKAGVTVSF